MVVATGKLAVTKYQQAIKAYFPIFLILGAEKFSNQLAYLLP
jgi:hypothetical protein